MATGILAMLAKPKGKPGGDSDGPPSSRTGKGSEVGEALMEMFDALKGGDASGAELAFRRAKEACDDSYKGDESMDEEMGGEEEDELDL